MATRRSLHSREYAVFLVELRRARKSAGVTQIELAKRLKQTQTFISKCERGERRLDFAETRDFCMALQVDFGRFASLVDAAISATSAGPRRRR
jgi:transcriptional regulator with XRE-family HTH domain